MSLAPADLFYPPPRFLVTLDQAREISGIQLSAAADASQWESGKSYDELEKESESTTHRWLKAEAMDHFVGHGYRIYPLGVGIRGIMCFADFLAVKPGRGIFVEALTDGLVTDEVIARKRQLAAHGEITFVVVTGTKRSRETELQTRKRQLALQHDVVALDVGYCGSGIQNLTAVPRFAFPLVNARIPVEIRSSVSDKHLQLTVSFIAPPFSRPTGVFLSSVPLEVGEYLDRIFRDIRQLVCSRLAWECSPPRQASGARFTDSATSRIAGRILLTGASIQLEVDLRVAASVRELLTSLLNDNWCQVSQSGDSPDHIAAAAARLRPARVPASEDHLMSQMMEFLRSQPGYYVHRSMVDQNVQCTKTRGNRAVRGLVAKKLIFVHSNRLWLLERQSASRPLRLSRR